VWLGVFSRVKKQPTVANVNVRVQVSEVKHVFENPRPINLFPVLNLEGYPNRDSLAYKGRGCFFALRPTFPS
jgi:hypothetical protein